MAIQKSKSLSNGVSGNYWKIVSISVDRMAMNMDVRLALFADAAHKDVSPVGVVKSFKLPCTKEELLGNLAATAYTKVMAKANTMMNRDMSGKAISPIPTDSDLAGGVEV